MKGSYSLFFNGSYLLVSLLGPQTYPQIINVYFDTIIYSNSLSKPTIQQFGQQSNLIKKFQARIIITKNRSELKYSSMPRFRF